MTYNRPMELHEAVEKGDIESVKQLMTGGADVNAKGTAELTPLHNAAGGGHKEIAEQLIAKGANVNAKSKWGQTPLHNAAYEGYKEIAELLIAAGADVNAKDDGDVPNEIPGETPLNHAEVVEENHSPENKVAKKEIADLLRKHGGKRGRPIWSGEGFED